MRSIARSAHCRWVSTPRGARLTANVTSTLQRFMRIAHHRFSKLCLVGGSERLGQSLSCRIAGEDESG